MLTNTYTTHTQAHTHTYSDRQGRLLLLSAGTFRQPVCTCKTHTIHIFNKPRYPLSCEKHRINLFTALVVRSLISSIDNAETSTGFQGGANMAFSLITFSQDLSSPFSWHISSVIEIVVVCRQQGLILMFL